MVEQSPEPMLEDVRIVFREAIRLCADWKLGGFERALSFRGLQQVSLSGVCDLVLSYRNEPLPGEVHDELWNLMIGRLTLKEELAEDPTYATGARCLDKLIQDQRADVRRREEWHREAEKGAE
jgi:hypothetical protein